MGGNGSGSPSDERRRGGRSKQATVTAGTGAPEKLKGMPLAIDNEFDRIAAMLEGVAFFQDSDAIAAMAYLSLEAQELREELRDLMKGSEEYEKLKRIELANLRALKDMWAQFGLTPRSRQILLVPKEEEELDELEQMMKDRG